MIKNDKKKYHNKLILISFFGVFFILFQKNLSLDVIFTDFDPKNEINTINGAFNYGEDLKYRISYGKKNKKKAGIVLAGHAQLTVKTTFINDQQYYDFTAQGKTNRFFSLFMNVNHYYHSIVNMKNMNAREHEMIIKEGKYTEEEHILFNADTLQSDSNISDILTTSYKLRATRPDTFSQNDTIFFDYYYNGNVYRSHLIHLGEEIINTKFGNIKTIKLSPWLEKGRVFKSNYGAYIWVTADQMSIPVKIEMPILVGSIYVKLISCKNTLFTLKK